jgi:hypothetical protein
VTVIEDTDGVTFTCTATSGGGTTSESVTIQRDATAPMVSIASPANDAIYTLDEELTAEYSCTDALAGVETCTGPGASGTLIDTSTAGAQSFAVTATDLAGNTTMVTHFYSVDEPLEPADLSLFAIGEQSTPVVGSQTYVSLSDRQQRPGGGQRGRGVTPVG